MVWDTYGAEEFADVGAFREAYVGGKIGEAEFETRVGAMNDDRVGEDENRLERESMMDT